MFTLSGLAAADSSTLPVCAVPGLSQCLHCYRIISKSEQMQPVSQKCWLSGPLWEKTGQGPLREGLCWRSSSLGLLIASVFGTFSFVSSHLTLGNSLEPAPPTPHLAQLEHGAFGDHRKTDSCAFLNGHHPPQVCVHVGLC